MQIGIVILVLIIALIVFKHVRKHNAIIKNQENWKKTEAKVWDKVYDDPVTGEHVVEKGGETIVFHKNGTDTKTFNFPDGRKKLTLPDSSEIWTELDGSTFERFPDGSTKETAADGTITEQDPPIKVLRNRRTGLIEPVPDGYIFESDGTWQPDYSSSKDVYPHYSKEDGDTYEPYGWERGASRVTEEQAKQLNPRWVPA